MNKIKMWNHLKHEHPMLAERIMQTHEVMPTSFYSYTPINAPMRDIRPRWAM